MSKPNYDFNDSSVPIEIKVNNDDTNISNKPVITLKQAKVEDINVTDSNVSTLFRIEQMRHTQRKELRYNPDKLGLTKNKNYMHPQLLNDNYILSKLTKQKMYYKSIQSKMVSPKAKPKTGRRNSMECPSDNLNNYMAPSKSDVNVSTRNSNNSDLDLSN